MLERALAEELTGHLGYDKHDPAGRGSGNSRNGTTPKTVLPDVGAVDLAVPRDRNGTFEPQIGRKGQTRLEGFNERIIALYARGMTTRDIRAHLREMYDVDVSPDRSSGCAGTSTRRCWSCTCSCRLAGSACRWPSCSSGSPLRPSATGASHMPCTSRLPVALAHRPGGTGGHRHRRAAKPRDAVRPDEILVAGHQDPHRGHRGHHRRNAYRRTRACRGRQPHLRTRALRQHHRIPSSSCSRPCFRCSSRPAEPPWSRTRSLRNTIGEER